MNHILLTFLFGTPILFLALFLTPFLISRSVWPQASFPAVLTATGLISVVLNTLFPIAMHVASVPISRFNLVLAHLPLTLVAALVFRLKKCPFLPEINHIHRKLLLMCGAFAIAVLPFTCLAGIDTYKWLDLAGAVQTEQSIPWFVHPLSLMGFTGRSYPSIQPLLLGCTLILGGLGVEWSFYLLSVLFGTLGIVSAYILGNAIHSNRRTALWMAFLYGFSPVFVRYNHWATGRGLLLALLPMFLLAILKLPKVRGFAFLLLMALLLPLSHKAGLVALGGILLSLLAVPPLPRHGGRVLIPLLAVCSTVGAVLLSPNMVLPFPEGTVPGFARTSIVRFGWLLPLAAVGLVLAPGWLTSPAKRRLVPAMIVTFPFSCSSSMYGALIALIFISMAASVGITWIEKNPPALFRRSPTFCARITITMVLIGALAILLNRSLTAMPRRIRAAAFFLEKYDPYGPYMIQCKPWRPQIQGYVSGSPRFSIERTGPVRVLVSPPPSMHGSPPRVLANWVAYTRHVFAVQGFSLDYYGKHPRTYYVTIEGKGDVPANGDKIYEANGVAIFKPAGQPKPDTANGQRATVN